MQRKSRPARTRRPALRKTKPLMMKRRPALRKKTPKRTTKAMTKRTTRPKRAPIKVKVPKNEMAYWTQKLKATPAKIHAAIKKAGTNKVAIVKKYL